MKISAVFTDIDDTILISGSEPSQKLLSTVAKLQQLNIPFIPITGRAFMSLMLMKSQLNLQDYLCGYNGAYAFDIKNNNILIQNKPQQLHLEKIITYLKQENINFALFDEENHRIVTPDANCQYAKFEAELNNLPLVQLPIEILKNIPSFKILAFSEPELTTAKVTLLQQHFSDIFKITISKPFFIEINNYGVSKGDCISKMCELLSIDINEVLCFGDSLNDLEMFTLVPNSVAVSNAKPEILALAKYKTAAVEEDGFSLFLDPLLAQL